VHFTQLWFLFFEPVIFSILSSPTPTKCPTAPPVQVASPVGKPYPKPTGQVSSPVGKPYPNSKPEPSPTAGMGDDGYDESHSSGKKYDKPLYADWP
jgi:hypothetical protein